MMKIWGGGQMLNFWCFGRLMVSIVSMGVKTSYFLAIVKTRYFLTNLFKQSCFLAMELFCFLFFCFVFMFSQKYMTAAFKKFAEKFRPMVILINYTEGKQLWNQVITFSSKSSNEKPGPARSWTVPIRSSLLHLQQWRLQKDLCGYISATSRD